MKILVDKMPETTKDCPYSCLRSNAEGFEWYSCALKDTLCCVNTTKCPYFSDKIINDIIIKFNKYRCAMGSDTSWIQNSFRKLFK